MNGERTKSLLDPEQDNLYSLALEFQRLHASGAAPASLRRCWSSLFQCYYIRFKDDPGSLYKVWIGDYIPTFNENENEMADVEEILQFVGAITKYFYKQLKSSYGGG